MTRRKGNSKPSPEPANSPINSDARKDTIIGVCAELDTLEAQRKEISGQIRKVKNKRIKGDLGMKISDFNIARRLYSLEGNDRDELLGTIRETFTALGVGEQLDWVSAAERADAASAPPSGEEEAAEAKAAEAGPVGAPAPA